MLMNLPVKRVVNVPQVILIPELGDAVTIVGSGDVSEPAHSRPTRLYRLAAGMVVAGALAAAYLARKAIGDFTVWPAGEDISVV